MNKQDDKQLSKLDEKEDTAYNSKYNAYSKYISHSIMLSREFKRRDVSLMDQTITSVNIDPSFLQSKNTSRLRVTSEIGIRPNLSEKDKQLSYK